MYMHVFIYLHHHSYSYPILKALHKTVVIQGPELLWQIHVKIPVSCQRFCTMTSKWPAACYQPIKSQVRKSVLANMPFQHGKFWVTQASSVSPMYQHCSLALRHQYYHLHWHIQFSHLRSRSLETNPIMHQCWCLVKPLPGPLNTSMSISHGGLCI